jgi:hypothetical protein
VVDDDAVEIVVPIARRRRTEVLVLMWLKVLYGFHRCGGGGAGGRALF